MYEVIGIAQVAPEGIAVQLKHDDPDRQYTATIRPKELLAIDEFDAFCDVLEWIQEVVNEVLDTQEYLLVTYDVVNSKE